MSELFHETQLRSLSKVVTWRILITVSHMINAVVATGSWLTGLQIAGLALVINSGLFWAHERSWNFIQWNRQQNPNTTFVEGQPRSLSKIVSWRVLITFSNFLIPFIITGSWGQAAIFAGMATVVNMVLYWSHERAWNRMSWGKFSKTNVATV
jgi:uncharacterized membrane protein